jgi:hypothetical protein
MTRLIWMSSVVFLLTACGRPDGDMGPIGDPGDFGDGDASEAGNEDEGGDGDGDGDGDGEDNGDGDGDGDGDDNGDGDGDGDETGDGDGDGDDTGGNGICGSSNGSGGETGQHSVAAPAYPDAPAAAYVPSYYADGEPLPVLIALHGAGDTAGNFLNVWKTIAEEEGFIVLVPESSSGGASWNAGKDTPIIDAVYNEVLADYDVDECRVYLTGYSAGAHVGYAIGLLNADMFAGLGFQAGSMQYAEQWGIWPNEVPRKIAVDIHHGTGDNVVPIGHATHARDTLGGAGHTIYYDTHPGGHEIGSGDPAAMWLNLSVHRLDE